ncbi:hypothetical protein PMZ80_008695 [Knufia obscura]|nr:hypothetical protein PMZ80_008695 [Knufia obscura]
MTPTSLDPGDLQSYNLFSQACADSDCVLYLANIERRISGPTCGDKTYSRGEEYYISEVYDDYTTVRLFNASGGCVGNAQCMDHISFLNEDVYSIDRYPDEEEKDEDDDPYHRSGYRDQYGNYNYDDSPDATHYYRDTILLLIQEKLVAYLLVRNLWTDNRSIRAKWVTDAFDLWQRSQSQKTYQHWLQLSKLMIAKLGNNQVSYPYSSRNNTSDEKVDLQAIVDTALQVSNTDSIEILRQALPLLVSSTGELSTTDISTMAKLCATLGFTSELKNTVREIFRRTKNVSIHLNLLCKFCESYLRSRHPQNEHYARDMPAGWILDASRSRETEDEGDLLDWALTGLSEAVEHTDLDVVLMPSDFINLLSFATGDFRNFVVRICLRSIRKPDIPLWRAFRVSKYFASETSTDVQHRSIASAAFEVTLPLLQKEEFNGSTLKEIIGELTQIDSALIKEVVRVLLTSQQMHMPNSLPSRCISSIPDLVQVTSEDPVSGPSISIFVTVMLAAYLACDVGTEPRHTYNDLRRPGVRCNPSCQICITLNGFLGNASERKFVSHRWKATTERAHAEQQIKNQIPNHKEVLRQSTGPAPGSTTHQLYLEEIDEKYKREHQAWRQRLKQFSETVDKVLKLQPRRASQQAFGTLHDTIVKHDALKAKTFLRDATKQSLASYHFKLPESEVPMEHTSQQLQLMIENCGGSISPLSRPGADKVVRIIASKGSVAGFRERLAMEHDAIQAYEQDHVPVTTICESDLEAFIDQCWYNSLVERLNISQAADLAPLSASSNEQSTGVQTDVPQIPTALAHDPSGTTLPGSGFDPSVKDNVLKRKADDISRGPLTDLANLGVLRGEQMTSSTQSSDDAGSGQKRPKTTADQSSAVSEKENEKGVRSGIEIVDLT